MNFKKIFSNVFIVLGALIGGGLATGKELSSFFCIFGKNFWLPCIIAVFTFILLTVLISKLNFTNANNITQFAFFCYRLVIASTMISALKEICLYLPNSTFFYIAFLILTFLLLFVSYNGISKLFNVIIPVVFMFLLLVSIFSIKNSNHSKLQEYINLPYSILNGTTYSALNLFLLLYIVKKSLTNCNRKEKFYTISITSILFSLLLIVFSFAILNSNTEKSIVPLLDMATKINSLLFFPCIICIILAIVSTFIGVAFSLTKYIKDITKIRIKFVNNAMLFVLCLLISNLGLDYLVNYGYKALGIFAIIYFIFAYIKEKITCAKASDKFTISSSSFINKFFYK